MDDHGNSTAIAVLRQIVSDLERRINSIENTSKVLVLLVLTTVIGTVLKFVGIG